jgi:hypothetical protein
VDLGDEARPVFPLGKGSEIEQLDRSAREWNATAGEGGQLVLAGSGAPIGRKRRIGWLRQR